ncbi:MAG: S8 family serine peptidase [Pseudomonadota bacterium]
MTTLRPAILAMALIISSPWTLWPTARAHAMVMMDPDIEEDIEEQAEDQAEDEAEEQAEAEAEEQAEQEAEAEAEQQAEQEAELQAEQEAEAEAEQQAEQEAEQQAEQEAEAEAEQQAEQEAEEQAETEAEEQAEQEAEDQAETEAEDQAEQEAEDEAEDAAEDEAEDLAEQEAEDEAGDEAEDQAEMDAEDDADNEVDNEIEDDAQDEVEDDYDEGEEAGEEARETEVEEADDDRFETEEYEAIEEETAGLASSFEASFDIEGIDTDEDEFEFASGEWLVLSSQSELERMVAAGFEIRTSERIDLLDQVLTRLGTPTGMTNRASRQTLLAIAPNADVEYNHLYSPQTRFRRAPTARAPLTAMPLSRTQRATRAKIGLIDTALSRSNSAFSGSRVVYRDFVQSRNPRPIKHGTAVASILVGQSQGIEGLLPRANLYAASVFEQLPGRGSTASTAGLIRALDWMVANDLKVVNMSLSGPPNRFLKKAIAKAAANGVTIVAAAGNEGPSSKPLFPAAYAGVVSVTALDQNNRVFRLANRGRYLEFSAPGVSILHAADPGTPDASSGTSIAAPFVSAALLLARGRDGRVSQSALNALRSGALDLGAKGRDSTYGYGLIRPQ